MGETESSHPSKSSASVKGAILSSLVPGLGQLIRGYPMHAVRVLGMGGCLGIVTWSLARIGGAGAGFFFGLLIIPPWWCLQAYAAWFPTPPGQLETLKIAWQRAHDVRYLGGLFLFTALTDLFIILTNPDYNLAVFCTRPEGIPGFLAKAQSPTLHLAIGYGFLRLRPWALFVYMAYAGFGLLNASANFACFGYGRIRTVFVLSLIGFTVYVFWRRSCLQPTAPASAR